MKKPLRLEVCSDAEAEAAAFVVCVRLADDPGGFTDNQLALCCACGEPVVFRPYMPKRPPRICLQCVLAREHLQ
jgi:hypothetical protein